MAKWIRSKVFKEVVYSPDIPNRLLVEEENGKVNVYGGKVYEKSQKMEKGTRVIRSYSRLGDAKKCYMKLWNKEQNHQEINRMSLEFVKVYNGHVVYVDKKSHQIVSAPIDPESQMILDWNNRNIPANYR